MTDQKVCIADSTLAYTSVCLCFSHCVYLSDCADLIPGIAWIKVEEEEQTSAWSDNKSTIRLLDMKEEASDTKHTAASPKCHTTNKRKFICSFCDMGFLRKSNIERHMVTHIGCSPSEKRVPSSICAKTFQCNSDQRRLTDEKQYTCQICRKKISQKGHMKIHMRIHTGEKPFSCQNCGRNFLQNSGLNVHMRIHTGEKPFPCQICGRKFSQKGNMETHMRTHTGEKPFSCQICSQKFSQKSHMDIHMRKHSGETFR